MQYSSNIYSNMFLGCTSLKAVVTSTYTLSMKPMLLGNHVNGCLQKAAFSEDACFGFLFKSAGIIFIPADSCNGEHNVIHQTMAQREPAYCSNRRDFKSTCCFSPFLKVLILNHRCYQEASLCCV